MENSHLQGYANLLETFLTKLEQLPIPNLGGVKEALISQIKELLGVVKDSRIPRIVLLGRRGAGKTSLLNAIYGRKLGEVGAVRSATKKANWYLYPSPENPYIEILDTRGLQEGGHSIEESLQPTMAAIRQKLPDAFLFLVKAKDVDSGIDQDLEVLQKVVEFVRIGRGLAPVVVASVTQCDQVDPPDVWIHEKDAWPDLWQEKLQHIEEARQELEKRLRALFPPSQTRVKTRVFPTAAYMRFRTDGSIDTRFDRRWGIEALKEFLASELPREAQVEFVRMARVRAYQRKIINNIIMNTTAVAFVIGNEPIPTADIFVLTPLQIAMVIVIGYVAGSPLSQNTAIKFLKAAGINVGSAFAFREIARGLVKFIPVVGSLASGGIAALGTATIGIIAREYFLYNRTIKEAKDIATKEAKRFVKRR